MQPHPPSLAQNVQQASVVEHCVSSGTHAPLPLPPPMLQNVWLHCDAHVPHVHPAQAFHSSIAFCDAASPQFEMHAALMFAHLLTHSLSAVQSESVVQILPLASHSFPDDIDRHVWHVMGTLPLSPSEPLMPPPSEPPPLPPPHAVPSHSVAIKQTREREKA
jgi:hypothetical protein